MWDKDLEAGVPLQSNTNEIGTPRKQQRRQSRRDSMLADNTSTPTSPRSPTRTIEEVFDPNAIIVASCDCKNSRRLEILPFQPPRNLKLSRPSKGFIRLQEHEILMQKSFILSNR